MIRVYICNHITRQRGTVHHALQAYAKLLVRPIGTNITNQRGECWRAHVDPTQIATK